MSKIVKATNTGYEIGDKAIKSLIAKIAKTATELKGDIHRACVSCAMHLAEHGDVENINRLCESVKDVVHNNAVHRWMEEYACVTWDTKNKRFNANKARLAEAREKAAEYLASVKSAKTYYELTKAPEFSPVKLLSVIKSALKRVDKMSDEERKNEGNDLRGMDELRAFVKRYDVAA